jgi:predicted nicotinamide N-methyase
VLAQVVCDRSLAGVRVLELGCGLGVPSIAAALEGTDVLATDWAPDAIELVAVNAARNGASLEARRLDWSAPVPLVDSAPWPLVIAADVLYERATSSCCSVCFRASWTAAASCCSRTRVVRSPTGSWPGPRNGGASRSWRRRAP